MGWAPQVGAVTQAYGWKKDFFWPAYCEVGRGVCEFGGVTECELVY